MNGQKDIMAENDAEKHYDPFLTNRALSYHRDTIFYAQEMNSYPGLDKRLQYRFLINMIRPQRRKGSKWAKKQESDDLKVVQEYFGYSYKDAMTALTILSKEQLKEIKRKLEKGGVK
jgi:hypothetical protein